MLMRLITGLAAAALLMIPGPAAADAPVSEDTQSCLECHQSVTPGIVAAWKASAHAKTTPAMGLKRDELARRVSAKKVPAKLLNTVVGCAECHTMNTKQHTDSFAHDAYTVHVVTSPKDCATCHAVEAEQYGHNLMSQAHGNLMGNPLLRAMVHGVLAPVQVDGTRVIRTKASPLTEAEACLSCHGTVVKVTGKKSRDTAMGQMSFPVLSGWPNQGVGRVNPDGSKGSCAACHQRHSFSIATARKPYTCGQCHKGPDVPAYKVYTASKHGNIFLSAPGSFDFKAVPWQAGRDFTTPTCAACHVSLITDSDGEVLVKRTHRMNDRLDVRLFGLIYAHPHAKSADTSIIKAPGGMSLPTNLNGEPAARYLIDRAEMTKRRQRMQQVCSACHSTSVVKGQFARLDHVIAETNQSVAAATALMQAAWKKGLAKDPNKDGNPFDEYIERVWMEIWLFYANSSRLASAMMGSDYGAFEGGRWQLIKSLQHLERLVSAPAKPAKPAAPAKPKKK